MHYRKMLRAGTAGAFGITFCLSLIAQVATAHPNQQAAAFKQWLKMASSQAPQSLGLAPAAQPIGPWQKLTVKSGDSLSSVFARAGLGARQWMGILQLKGRTGALKHLHPGEALEIRKTQGGHLDKLKFRLDDVETLIVSRDGNRLRAHVEHRPTSTRRIAVRGTVRHSLAKALATAGAPSTVSNQLAQIYRYRENLSRHVHPGDHFSLIYNATYSHGHRVAVGPIVAASITINGRSLKAFRATNKAGVAGYYDITGHSYKPSISRHPVNYTRISSPFSLHRMNPVLHIVRPHYGVDMAAPLGTPIHAAADGTVRFAGREHGYGRVVILRHFEGYSTRYAHMHRFAKGLHDGEHVRQGEIIGYVGESGEATGPHLHFEIRKNGVPHNPLKMKLPAGKPLPKSQLARFNQRIKPLIAALERHPNHLVASASSRTQGIASDCVQHVALRSTFGFDPLGAANGTGLKDIACAAGQSPNHT